MRACAIGQSFDDALREMGRRAPGTRGLAETLRTSARLGSPAAPALARLAAELRADLRRRAEARARTVPVRLCFPLVGCILPAFALLTVVPAVVAGITPLTRPPSPHSSLARVRVRPSTWEVVRVAIVVQRVARRCCGRADRSESGQSTAEYALVMISAAAIAGLVLTWAKHTNLIGGLFDTVVHGLLHL